MTNKLCKGILGVFVLSSISIGILISFKTSLCISLYLLGGLLLLSALWFMYKLVKDLLKTENRLYRVMRNDPKLHSLLPRNEVS